MRVPAKQNQMAIVSSTTHKKLQKKCACVRACATLVYELVEGVLAVGSRLAPHDGPGVIVDPASFFSDVLAIGLHVPLRTSTHPPLLVPLVCVRTDARAYLLEIGGKAVHVLVVGQHGVRLGRKEVDVPNAQQRQHHRQVPLQGRVHKVIVLQIAAILPSGTARRAQRAF